MEDEEYNLRVLNTQTLNPSTKNAMDQVCIPVPIPSGGDRWACAAMRPAGTYLEKR